MYSQACIEYEVYHNSLQLLSSDCGARLGSMSLGESKSWAAVIPSTTTLYLELLFVHLFDPPLC